MKVAIVGMWAFAGPVTAWTNAFLQPPPPHVIELFVAAASDPSVADAVADAFALPAQTAQALSTPESTAAFIESARNREMVGAE